MFSNSIFAFKDSSNDNYFDNSLNYVPNVDQKLQLYLEKKCNKSLTIHFPKDFENDEIFQIKDEDILPTNNNFFLGNIIGLCSLNVEDKIVNEINSKNLELEELNEEDSKELINSLNEFLKQ